MIMTRLVPDFRRHSIPGITALPLYIGACPIILCHETPTYEERAWTRLERVLSFSFSGSLIAMAIQSGFLHRYSFEQWGVVVVRCFIEATLKHS